MRIGYIGLGAIGGALARRLLPGHQLVVWDLSPPAVAQFTEAGAETVASAAELARCCDVVLLCLPCSSHVQPLLFGPAGLGEGLSPGKLVIDQTSGSPNQTRAMAERLAAQGVGMIDAPVSGGDSGAVAGTITIMASGPAEAYEQALPVLHAISPNVFRCGNTVGDAQAMKLVNNAMSAGCQLATLEVVAMGRKMGLSLPVMTDVINKGSGRNRTSKLMLPAMIENKPSTSLVLALMLKDMNQALQLGMDCNAPMPITNTTRTLLQLGVNLFGEQAQLEDTIRLVEQLAATKLTDVEATRSPPPSETTEQRELVVGYVGLGAMGGALTRRLMLSRKMRVHDIQPATVQAFVAEGASAPGSLPELARECDVIMVCVPTSADVRTAIFGPEGLAQGLAAGKIIVDQTTGDPIETRRIAEDLAAIGVALVDAPVSGGPRGAVAGTIAIMCGGPAEAYAAVSPILAAISPNSVYCGQCGNGHLAKLVNNAVASCNRLITYEAVTVGFKYGLKLDDMSTIINKSTGWNGASERILPVLSRGGQTAAFQLRLMAKDLRLAAQMGIACGAPMLIAGTVRSLFEMGANELGGGANLDEMAVLFERMASISFSAQAA